MKVHLTPSIYNKYSDVHVELIDLEFPELNIVLKQGVDVVASTPYPNKCISVVRRKKGRKAINGFFVDIPTDMKTITLKTRWSVDSERILVHTVNYNLIDSDYDFATQDPTMWYATYDGSQESRMPCDGITPCYYNARMEIVFNEKETRKQGDYVDFYQDSKLVSRVENYPLPTIKGSHLFGKYNSHLARMPSVDDSF